MLLLYTLVGVCIQIASSFQFCCGHNKKSWHKNILGRIECLVQGSHYLQISANLQTNSVQSTSYLIRSIQTSLSQINQLSSPCPIVQSTCMTSSTSNKHKQQTWRWVLLAVEPLSEDLLFFLSLPDLRCSSRSSSHTSSSNYISTYYNSSPFPPIVQPLFLIL